MQKVYFANDFVKFRKTMNNDQLRI